MTTIWSILLAILIFGCIIAIHEFGHFIEAKRNGIQVNEFAIGMGPKIFRFQKGETLYSLRLFPIGGFCSMEGEDAESKNARAFDQKPVWRRMIVVLAGAFMNLVLGFVLLIATTCSDPYLISNTIHGFHKQATSNTCGLQAGDTIVSLNGSHIFTITDLQYKLSNESGEPFTVVVERDGKKVKLQDVTFRDQENNDWLDFSLEPQQIKNTNIDGNKNRQMQDRRNPFRSSCPCGCCIADDFYCSNWSRQILNAIFSGYQFYQRHPDEFSRCNGILCRIGKHMKDGFLLRL